MTKLKNRIFRHRDAAAERQAGRCFYCFVLMCRINPSDFAASCGLSLAQVIRLRCTAEHLIARQDGGGNASSNIVAACWHCNQARHRRKQPPNPLAYRSLVMRRVRAGRWHPNRVFEAGLLCRNNDMRQSALPMWR